MIETKHSIIVTIFFDQHFGTNVNCCTKHTNLAQYQEKQDLFGAISNVLEEYILGKYILEVRLEKQIETENMFRYFVKKN